MRSTTTSLCSVLAAAALGAGCDGLINDDFYVRLVPLSPFPGASQGSLNAVFTLDGRLFQPSEGQLQELTPTGPVEVPGVSSATLHHGAIFGLAQQGTLGVVRSDDAVTFTPVSTEVFGKLTATNDALYGLRVDGDLRLFRSDDDGLTWLELPESVPFLGFNEIFFNVLGNDGEVFWVIAIADVSASANSAPAGQIVEVRGSAVTKVAEIPFPTLTVFPRFVTADGLAVGALDNLPERKPDQLLIGLREESRPGLVPDFKPLHFSSPFFNDLEVPASPLGLDADGHLLVGMADMVMRSELPLSLSNNQRDEILAGPGCQQRNHRERVIKDINDVVIRNEGPETVFVRTVDDLGRWFSQGPLAAGAELTTRINGGGYVMASDPADDTCLGYHDAPDEGGEVVLR